MNIKILKLSFRQRLLSQAVRLALGGAAAFSGVVSAQVYISPFIAAGSQSTGDSGGAAPNLWFFINNNQSMAWEYYSDNKNVNYDANYDYEIPYKPDGTRFPSPPTTDDHTYETPFLDYLAGKKDNNFEVNEGGGVGLCSSDSKPVADPENCRIWETYYGTRIKSIKSILSIVLIDEKERFKNTRVGYKTPFPTSNAKANKREGGEKDKLLPVLPLTSSENHEKFMRWTFGIGKVADDMAIIAPVAKSITEISNATKKNDKKNPFIMNPSRDYDAINNPMLGCRRNHLLILSDGLWDNEEFSDNLYKKYKAKSTEKSRTLPDGVKYNPISPYKRNISSDFPDEQRSLADVTFQAWAADMDGDSTNNKYNGKNNAVPPYFPKVDGVVQEHKGSTYWHPYNDPAEWQHINTHTIGFDLEKSKKEEMARINPPLKDADGNYTTTTNNLGIRDKYLADNWRWKFENLGSGIDKADVHKDMANAALAGRGRFYNAKTAKQLKEAITDILDMINEQVVKPGVRGSAGALASIQSDGNSFYSTRYDADSFTGEVVRRNLFSGKESEKNDCFKAETLSSLPSSANLYGRVCDKSIEWNAAKELVDDYGDNFAQRKVLTAKRENDKFVGQTFTVGNLTSEQKTRIKGSGGFPTTFNGFSDDDEKFAKLINYLRGDKEQEDANVFHSRDTTFEDGTTGRNILGAIMRSSPIVSGIPRVSDLHSDKQSTEYIDFVKRYLYKDDGTSLCTGSCSNPIAKNDVDIIYVGANDGMLHAFKAIDGKEVFSYVPDAVYKNLAQLTEDRKHISFVDGNIGVVVIDGENKKWTKFLTGSMGGGAKGIYALDVTNPTANGTNAKDIVKWEFTDKDSGNIGNIIAKPATVQLNDGTWAVVVGNGYNSSNNKAALIIVNALTGKLIQEIILDNSYTDNNLPNGLAPAYFQVFPGKESSKTNGIDRAYAGDLQGNMWVFDFSKANKNGGVTVAGKSNTEVKPLFVAQYTDGSKIVKQPITVAPLVRQHPTKYGNMVHFGTGALFDENDLSSNIKNSIYAIWDDWLESGIANGSGLPSPRTGRLVELSHLKELEFDELNGEELSLASSTSKKVIGRTLKKSDKIKWATRGLDFTDKKRGWYIDLPVGERAWQSPYYTFGAKNTEAVGYDTVNYKPAAVGSSGGSAAVDCSSGASGAVSWKMAFNIDDGSKKLPYYGTIDTDGDSNITEADMVSKGAGVASLTGMSNEGVVFSDNSMSTFSPQEETKGVIVNGSNVCNFITQTHENDGGKFKSKQICRSSHAGTWVELR